MLSNTKENYFNPRETYKNSEYDNSSVYGYNPKPLTRNNPITDSLSNFMGYRNSRSNFLRQNNPTSFDKMIFGDLEPCDKYNSDSYLIENRVQGNTIDRGLYSRGSINNSSISKNFVIKSRIVDNILGTTDNMLNSLTDQLNNTTARSHVGNKLPRDSKNQSNFDQYLSSVISKDQLTSTTGYNNHPAGRASVINSKRTPNFKISNHSSFQRMQLDIDALYANIIKAQVKEGGSTHNELWDSLISIMSSRRYEKFCADNKNDGILVNSVKKSIRKRLENKLRPGRKEQLASLIERTTLY